MQFESQFLSLFAKIANFDKYLIADRIQQTAAHLELRYRQVVLRSPQAVHGDSIALLQILERGIAAIGQQYPLGLFGRGHQSLGHFHSRHK